MPYPRRQHWNTTATLDAIASHAWDVVVMQEFSSGLAQADDVVCADSYPYAENLINGNAGCVSAVSFIPISFSRVGPAVRRVHQFYLTWGRPYEDPECPTNPYVCDFDVMQDRLTRNYRNDACMFRPAALAPVRQDMGLCLA